MKRTITILSATLMLSACSSNSDATIVTDFASCVAAGNPVMESYPRRCNADGATYTEDIGNELELTDVILVNSPRPNQTISSPLTINGQARGPWYFEASFPVILVDSQGQELATTIAQAQGDWMTDQFVPFIAQLQFPSQPSGSTGTLILKKDNPSDDRSLDQQLIIPVTF